MPGSSSPHAIIAQSGGPTAVINQSLIGCVQRWLATSGSGRLLGARHAVRGIVNEDFIDFLTVDPALLTAVAASPSAALGSSRDKPDEEYCRRIAAVLAKHDISVFFYIGGNDSADTCRIVAEFAHANGQALRAFHIPKTIDNDLVENDHCPGYASAARYVAKLFVGDDLDNRALPGVKINVVMGRHAGFLTAAAAMARSCNSSSISEPGPHLLYLPERPTTLRDMCVEIAAVYTRIGRCQVAVSEGIRDAESGKLLTEVFESHAERDAHGNVQLSGSGTLGDQLADAVRVFLKGEAGVANPRVRADTLGYAQRSFPDPSPVDQTEAEAVGSLAAEMALADHPGGSITIKRTSNDPYEVAYEFRNLAAIAQKTRHMPDEFIAASNHDVTDGFLQYLQPLVGALPAVQGFI
ncbi:MAG: diphosphate--fructose-6-phosphate 1-phosphotransferase [Phycisphaerales bacterium]